MEDRLILICEGGAHMVEYFIKNGVYPAAVVFNAKRYSDMVPYLTERDEVLLVINGLTDFTLRDIYSMLNDMLLTGRKLKSVTVMSNIHLGSIPTFYYLYSGDLFYGDVKRVENNKVMDLKPEDYELAGIDHNEKMLKSKKNAKSSGTDGQKNSINAVMSRYKKYNQKVRIQIYGSAVKEVTPPDYEEESLLSKIILIDLFK